MSELNESIKQVIEKQLADGDMIAIGQNNLRFTLEA